MDMDVWEVRWHVALEQEMYLPNQLGTVILVIIWKGGSENIYRVAVDMHIPIRYYIDDKWGYMMLHV